MNIMKPYSEFAEAIGLRESSGKYDAKNSLGFLGKYQFGLARLTDLGLCRRKPMTVGYANSCFEFIPPHSEAEFLGSPTLQEEMFRKHVTDLKRQVRRLESGLVAGAHLLGMGGVRALLFEGTVQEDANGTRITSYISKFSNYEL